MADFSRFVDSISIYDRLHDIKTFISEDLIHSSNNWHCLSFIT